MTASASHVPLSQYLGRIQAALAAAMPDNCWVVAELSEIKHSPKGHIYIDLLESQDGREVARARGVAFASVARGIMQQWHDATGGAPQPGMKLMVSVKAEFTPQFGMSLRVMAIDPAFTLGDMQIQLQRVIAGLKNKGWFDRQRQLPSPTGYRRIGVIAPNQAAGLADFRRDADRLAEAGVCEFEYFSAVFQGKDSSESIRTALGEAHRRHQTAPFDVVCIIRGGGAKGDLAWLNDGNLASWVCRLPVPVFTGIGHEIDECVLDLVARRQFDTPSKVIGHFRYVFQREAEAIRMRTERITNGLMQLVRNHRQWLEQTEPKLAQQAQQLVLTHRNRLMMLDTGFGQNVQQAAGRQRMMIQQVDGRFSAGAKALLAKEKSRLELATTIFDKTNPLALLDRGFAVARNRKGEVVTSAEQAKAGGWLSLTFGDGSVEAVVEKNTKAQAAG